MDTIFICCNCSPHRNSLQQRTKTHTTASILIYPHYRFTSLAIIIHRIKTGRCCTIHSQTILTQGFNCIRQPAFHSKIQRKLSLLACGITQNHNSIKSGSKHFANILHSAFPKTGGQYGFIQIQLTLISQIPSLPITKRLLDFKISQRKKTLGEIALHFFTQSSRCSKIISRQRFTHF